MKGKREDVTLGDQLQMPQALSKGLQHGGLELLDRQLGQGLAAIRAIAPDDSVQIGSIWVGQSCKGAVLGEALVGPAGLRLTGAHRRQQGMLTIIASHAGRADAITLYGNQGCGLTRIVVDQNLFGGGVGAGLLSGQ